MPVRSDITKPENVNSNPSPDKNQPIPCKNNPNSEIIKCGFELALSLSFSFSEGGFW